MSKIAVMSDLHLGFFDQFASPDGDTGLNSRMMQGIKILQQIRSYCIRHRIGVVLNGGDLVHKGATIRTDLLNILVDELVAFQASSIKFITIPGQHDFARRDGSYNLPKALAPLMVLMNEPGEDVHLEGARVVGCPYREGLDSQKKALDQCKAVSGQKNIFLGHFLVKEILKADGVNYDASCPEYADLPRGFDLYLFGDYHPHVCLPKLNLVSIGTTHHDSFKDKNLPQGGFLVLDTEAMKFKRVELDAPMFLKVSPDSSFPEGYSPNNFYEIVVRDREEQDRLLGKLDDSWNATFSIISEEVENPGVEKETEISLSTDPREVVRKYCERFGLSDAYLEKGLEFLGGKLEEI